MSAPTRVLALDSVGRVTTLALGTVAPGRVTVERTLELPPRRAAAELVQGIAGVLEGLAPAGLSALVAVRGPGSFTGMRAGLSTLKAVSEAAGVRLVGISRLAVLAARAGLPRAALDAGRGGLYVRGEDGQERLLAAVEAAAQVGSAPVAVCEDRLAETLAGARRVDEPTASDALRFAAGRILRAEWDDPVTLDALYLWQEEQMFAGSRV